MENTDSAMVDSMEVVEEEEEEEEEPVKFESEAARFEPWPSEEEIMPPDGSE